MNKKGLLCTRCPTCRGLDNLRAKQWRQMRIEAASKDIDAATERVCTKCFQKKQLDAAFTSENKMCNECIEKGKVQRKRSEEKQKKEDLSRFTKLTKERNKRKKQKK